MENTSRMGQDSAHELLESILIGAKRSASVFSTATGGCRLSEASEHFLTAGIFEALSKKKGYTHLEVSVSSCLKEANAIRKGRPAKKDRANGRYDLVHYRLDESPRAAIEVKNGIRNLNRQLLDNDFRRLSRSLTASNESSYQFCVFVFFATKDYPKKETNKKKKRNIAKERLALLVEGINSVSAEFTKNQKRQLIRRVYCDKTHYSQHDDEGAWTVGMVVFADQKSAATFPKSLLVKKEGRS